VPGTYRRALGGATAGRYSRRGADDVESVRASQTRGSTGFRASQWLRFDCSCGAQASAEYQAGGARELPDRSFSFCR